MAVEPDVVYVALGVARVVGLFTVIVPVSDVWLEPPVVLTV